MAEASTKECEFCKEEIKADAIRCKHCGSAIDSPGPTHGGTCPYCKEEINPDAVKCKWCGSTVAEATQTAFGYGCGCGGTEPGSHAPLGVPARFGHGQVASPSMMQSASFRQAPGRFGRGHVILGGPFDPNDPWYCDGHYECTVFFGRVLCIWVCNMY